MIFSFMFLFGGCNSDYNVKTFGDPELGQDTSPPPAEEEADPPPPPPEECPERIWSAMEIGIDEMCFIPPDTSTFEPVVEWQMSSFDEFPDAVNTLETPIVGNLTDDNGDGLINDDDIPDIVLSMHEDPNLHWCSSEATAGVLRVISGDGSTVHWSIRDVDLEGQAWLISGASNPAIGDIDNDGLPEIVVGVYLGYNIEEIRVVAFDHTGVLEWWTEIEQMWMGQPCGVPMYNLAIGDVDADGYPEIFAGTQVYNGEDGSLQFSTEEYTPVSKSAFSFPIDLEKDGVVEVVNSRGIYDSEGNPRCRFMTEINLPAVGDVDGDGVGDIVGVDRGLITVYDAECRVQTYWTTPDPGSGGPPTLADYDGDGVPEIGVASYDYYFVFEVDGTLLWEHEVSDRTSNQTGSAVFDFEGDGYSEVVYGGEYNLWVFSGVDGTPRMQDTSHYSCTGYEYPVIVDVDRDNQVEIVAVDYYGVRVIGDLNESWVDARPVWNQHAYSITNINDDLSIPTYADSNWPTYNNFRSGDIRLNNGNGANQVDMVPLITDICEVECDRNQLEFTLQIGNMGLADYLGEVQVQIYVLADEIETPILSYTFEESMIRSGFSTAGEVFRFDLTDVPSGRMVVSVDDTGEGLGIVEECNETNNRFDIGDVCVGSNEE